MQITKHSSTTIDTSENKIKNFNLSQVKRRVVSNYDSGKHILITTPDKYSSKLSEDTQLREGDIVFISNNKEVNTAYLLFSTYLHFIIAYKIHYGVSITDCTKNQIGSCIEIEFSNNTKTTEVIDLLHPLKLTCNTPFKYIDSISDENLSRIRHSIKTVFGIPDESPKKPTYVYKIANQYVKSHRKECINKLLEPSKEKESDIILKVLHADLELTELLHKKDEKIRQLRETINQNSVDQTYVKTLEDDNKYMKIQLEIYNKLTSLLP